MAYSKNEKKLRKWLEKIEKNVQPKSGKKGTRDNSDKPQADK